MADLDYSLCPPFFLQHMKEAFDEGDVGGILMPLENMHYFPFVLDNFHALVEREIFEETLFHAFTGCRVNNAHIQHSVIRFMLGHIAENPDRLERFRSYGNRLPGSGPWTVYRGVSGKGPARRVRGFSWTGSRERAEWFANRLPLPDPAVFVVEVDAGAVLCYTNRRQEEEFIVLLPESARPRRLR